MLIPTSRDTLSSDELSGGNSRATIRSLYACPYRATFVFQRPPKGSDPIRAATVLTQGGLVGISPARFVPVRLIEAPPAAAAIPSSTNAAAETIEISLPDGSRVRVGNDVSLATLRRVMTALRG
jgi:hypothetical protein